ncbi:MAG TPA: universal stress protein [Kofleriaceae bacterium]|nr:universal stress protein [Kofleriaceae bacterium]
MIICGTDLSEASRRALDVACALASQRGEPEVVLVHAVEDLEGAELAERKARLAAKAAAQPGVRGELIVGPPDEALVRFAETAGADLIVVAARSRGDKLGTTAGNIITRTHVPVIAVRDPAPWLAFARGERPLRLLLGVDEAATAELAVQWTHGLALRGTLDVVLGTIYYPDDAAAYYGLPAHGFVESDPESERLLQRDMIRRFSGAASPARSVTAVARRGLGRIGDHIIELASEQAVDAIVIGTSQKTGLGRLGSVSSIVVEEAAQSVVCVPPHAAITTQSVPVLQQALVATDLSQFANRAVPYAFALTVPTGDIHLLHVVKEDDDTTVDDAALLAQLAQLAPAGAPQRVHAHVVRGDDTATTIAQCAARFGVDVICVASHGRSGLTRALVGSVADRLLRATRLPVLVLRPGET